MRTNGRHCGRYTPPKRRVLALLAEVPEDAPPAVKEGLARRRLVATTGRCPCGAVLVVPERIQPGTVTRVAVEHEPTCPATDEFLLRAMGRT